MSDNISNSILKNLSKIVLNFELSVYNYFSSCTELDFAIKHRQHSSTVSGTGVSLSKNSWLFEKVKY
jgi:hypothetical protein